MSPDTYDDETPAAAEAETPPPRPRSGRPMASFEQWEQGGKGPSGPTIVSIAFSAGVIALGLLLAMNGVLTPPKLTELNDPSVKRGWAPFFDVSAVGAATAEGAQAETARPQPPAASPAASPETERQQTEPGTATTAEPRTTTPSAARAPASQTQEQSDPNSQLEEATRAAPAPTAAPASPQVQSAPRIIGEKNTSATTEAPASAPASAAAGSKGKSTWGGGERTPVEGR